MNDQSQQADIEKEREHEGDAAMHGNDGKDTAGQPHGGDSEGEPGKEPVHGSDSRHDKSNTGRES